MANGHGGPRTPRQPAPASGPGSLSKRTDGGPAQVNAQLSNPGYGEQAEFQAIQSGAPMAAAPPVPSAQQQGMGGGADVLPPAPPLPLTADTERPDEPITYGASFGPGPGPNGSRSTGRVSDILARLMHNDESGAFQDLYEIARRKGF